MKLTLTIYSPGRKDPTMILPLLEAEGGGFTFIQPDNPDEKVYSGRCPRGYSFFVNVKQEDSDT